MTCHGVTITLDKWQKVISDQAVSICTVHNNYGYMCSQTACFRVQGHDGIGRPQSELLTCAQHLAKGARWFGYRVMVWPL